MSYLFNQYFVQIGIILFPILFYQLWAFRKSFTQLPYKIPIMGLYGGLTAIAIQLEPVHIFGISENFQCVPIILSILYGKRIAGIISITIVGSFQFLTAIPLAWVSVLAIIIYSALPFVLCIRFETYSRIKRIEVAILLSILTLIIQLLTIVVIFIVLYQGEAVHVLLQLTNFFVVAVLFQFTLMSLALLLMENIIEDGRIRNELYISEERYRSLVHFNPNGICAFDRNSQFIMVNSAYESLTGYTKSELEGNSRLLLWYPEDHALASSLLQSALRGEVMENVEFAMRHKNGNKIFVRCTNVPIVLGNKIDGFYSVLNDITETKITGDLLKKSEKLAVVGQLAAGVAHEIRNPLTSLKGFLKLLEEKAAVNRRYFSVIRNELARIELFSSELLMLAKPQAEKFMISNLNVILLEVTELMKSQANMRNVNIETDLSSSIPLVLCEKNQIKQVFINVIKNAIDAIEALTTSCRTVKISSEIVTAKVKITVQDTGVGMSMETISRLGEPFYTTKGAGTGLGLMVTHKIIENHHALINYDSRVGEGTTVTLWFEQQD